MKKYDKSDLVDFLLKPIFTNGPIPGSSTIEIFNRWLLSPKRTGKRLEHYGLSDIEALKIYCELTKI
jgi:hypothetical protein